ncbi:MASE1 domain-containing protein [Thermomonas mangrovi]|uniref:MASE1 domain-containing protein n=1 Tax=Thermomonas mangrovi TaxID=2993316 RepID=UPI002307EDCF
MALYAAGHYLLVLPANLYWHPPAGWRFLWLLFTPPRLWPALLVAEWAIYLPDSLQMFTGHGGWMTALTLARMIGLMSGPWWLRHSRQPLLLDDASSMQRLLLAIAASALGNAVFNTWRPFDGEVPESSLELFLQIALGDINGTLMLAPLGLLLLRNRSEAAQTQRWKRDIPLVLLPALLLYASTLDLLGASVYFFATSLCALPVLYFALRTGWRGVAIALPLANIAVASASILTGNTAAAVQVQLFLSIIGMSGLLLGASVDELTARNDALVAGNVRLDRLSDELRSAARRNLSISEDLRRRLALELHDELGQNLTALQTRIKLAERKAGDPEAFAPLREILDHMRRRVSGLMNSLRPAGLDAFGLARSLQQGSIRDLMETSGMAYRLHIEDGDGLLERLDDDTQTAIYRIVQEAATNAVRHADACNLLVRLRARSIGSSIRIGLSIEDDGRGIDPASLRLRNGGMGLQGIRDRVLLLGGRLRIRSGARGMRLVVAFRTPAS